MDKKDFDFFETFVKKVVTTKPTKSHKHPVTSPTKKQLEERYSLDRETLEIKKIK
ncbi:MAG: hypothetical protein GDA51_01180 [Ekhidna sp.]|nr:hypothetical protein [Ekhidna sp.]